IEKQFYGLGLAKAIKDEFEALVKEKNVLNLDDSNSILRAIIDDSDAPFIYEKVGVRFDRFLLDEFQDTSNIQWENFKPLLKESVSKAGDEYVQGDDLIVGDVKQSIYRWRDSDWRLLQSAVKSTFALYADDRTTLDTNYRSLGEVINFNNAFFAKAAEWVDEAAKEDGYDTARTIYGDVAQKIKEGNEEGGYVSIRFADGEEGERLKVKEAVAEALAAGYREKDIAVLCRKNRECGIVAYDLIGEGYNVITTASLKVSASPAVCHLVALLSLMDNPDDAIAEYYCKSLGVGLPGRADSLTDLCEEILRDMKDAGESVDGEIPYVECFLDLVLEYSKNYGNDLHGFLEWYEGKASKTYISQPGDTDAVTIMTVHKSKGLEFPVVIVPFAETITMRFKKTSEKWAAPKLDGTPLDGAVDGIYNVNMLSTDGTLFAESSSEELRMTRIDGLNDAYVAFTRAGEALYIIAAETEVDKYEHIGEFLRKYVDGTGTDEYGKLMKTGGKEKNPAETLDHSVFESWPLNPEYVSILDEDGEMTDIREGGRLKFSTDSVDFFDDEGNAGAKASKRIRGIVLHNILSKVVVPDDLPKAVEDSVRAGELSEEEGAEALARLSSGIRRKAGFFPDDRSLVFNEVSLVDTDGTVSRPDRVVDDGENVLIIDYKYGAERKSYDDQIKRYKALYEAMGRKNVKAELWYVDRD
ncbi:MAG: UvrD-helicase domain-containing protein, partial [Bacteroidales bacterium]|nr:UvrD-helicase domain-containing protein [Bacteroidales bacterium]